MCQRKQRFIWGMMKGKSKVKSQKAKVKSKTGASAVVIGTFAF
jgi:hypothetical protein